MVLEVSGQIPLTRLVVNLGANLVEFSDCPVPLVEEEELLGLRKEQAEEPSQVYLLIDEPSDVQIRFERLYGPLGHTFAFIFATGENAADDDAPEGLPVRLGRFLHDLTQRNDVVNTERAAVFTLVKEFLVQISCLLTSSPRKVLFLEGQLLRDGILVDQVRVEGHQEAEDHDYRAVKASKVLQDVEESVGLARIKQDLVVHCKVDLKARVDPLDGLARCLPLVSDLGRQSVLMNLEEVS